MCAIGSNGDNTAVKLFTADFRNPLPAVENAVHKPAVVQETCGRGIQIEVGGRLHAVDHDSPTCDRAGPDPALQPRRWDGICRSGVASFRIGKMTSVKAPCKEGKSE